MNVEHLMTRHPKTCAPTDTLHRAAELMWEHDCGSIPVVDGQGGLVGIITDRDVCMSSFTRGRPLHEIQVDAAMSRDLFTVHATTPIAEALERFAHKSVRRIPVVDAGGELVGILTVADLVNVHARDRSNRHVKPEAVLKVVEAVSKPRPTAASSSASAAAKPDVIIPQERKAEPAPTASKKRR